MSAPKSKTSARASAMGFWSVIAGITLVSMGGFITSTGIGSIAGLPMIYAGSGLIVAGFGLGFKESIKQAFTSLLNKFKFKSAPKLTTEVTPPTTANTEKNLANAQTAQNQPETTPLTRGSSIDALALAAGKLELIKPFRTNYSKNPDFRTFSSMDQKAPGETIASRVDPDFTDPQTGPFQTGYMPAKSKSQITLTLRPEDLANAQTAQNQPEATPLLTRESSTDALVLAVEKLKLIPRFTANYTKTTPAPTPAEPRDDTEFFKEVQKTLKRQEGPFSR